jgi:undecaprenyl-diphosphatase
MLLYGSLFNVASRMGPFRGWRLVQALAALMILGIGFSRIYVGAHWPTDVLGGYLWGATFLLAAVMLCERVWSPQPEPVAAAGADEVYVAANARTN